MAVVFTQTRFPSNTNGVASVGGVSTYSGVNIGTPTPGRIVVLGVGSEANGASPNSATIDYGSGAIVMSSGTLGNIGQVNAQLFYLALPIGVLATTATFAITYGAAVTGGANGTNNIYVYAVAGADGTIVETGGHGDTDSDPILQATGAIPTDGGLIALFVAATDTVARTWTGATVEPSNGDVDAGSMRMTVASNGSAGTTTLTASGINNENGAISYLIFAPAVSTGGEAILPGSGALSATASMLANTRSALTGAGALNVSARLLANTGTSLTGNGALAVNALATRSATANLAGDSGMLVDAIVVPLGGGIIWQGSATLAGVSNLSLSANITAQAAAWLGASTVTTLLTTAGDSVLVTDSGLPLGSTSFTIDTSQLSATALLIQQANATLSGAGTLAADAQAARMASATLQGDSNLIASAALQLPATATLSGSGTLSVDAQRVAFATSQLTGAGALTATASLNLPATVTLAGAGKMIAVSVPAGIQPASATLIGNGALNVSARLIERTSATLAGSGAISVLASLQQRSSAILAGAGTLSVDARGARPATASLAGSGALNVSGRLLAVTSVNLNGAGTLSADARRIVLASATLNGAGALSAVAAPSASASATLSGAGALTVNAGVVIQAAASLASSGGLTVSASLIEQTSAFFTGTGKLFADATGGIVTATLTGGGAMTVSARVIARTGATLAGSGVLDARPNLIMQQRLTLTGSGSINANAQAPATPVSVTLHGTGALIIDDAGVLVIRSARKLDTEYFIDDYGGDCFISDVNVFVSTAA